MSDDATAVSAAFARYVNLSARELEHWLRGEASQVADADAIAFGREVLRLLRTVPGERTGADAAIMRGVLERITAERERRPDGDPVDSPWRHGLMALGHDPVTWSTAPLPAAAVASPGRAAPDPRPGGPRPG